MRHLSRLYPRRWRRRYGAEFEALIEELPTTPRNLLDVASGAFSAHLAEGRHYAAGLVLAVAIFLIAQLMQLIVLMLVMLVSGLLTTPGHFPVFDLRIGSLDFYNAWQHDRSYGVGLGSGTALISALIASTSLVYRARLAR